MVYHTDRAKRIATELNRVEAGDEVSLYFGGQHFRGQILGTHEDVSDSEVEFLVENSHGESVYEVFVECEADTHYDANNEDFDIHAQHVDETEDHTMEVEALANWETEDNAPDITMDEVWAEEDEETAMEMEEELNEGIEDAEQAITELHAVKEAFEGVKHGDDTFADFEETLATLAMENGGSLAVDSF